MADLKQKSGTVYSFAYTGGRKLLNKYTVPDFSVWDKTGNFYFGLT